MALKIIVLICLVLTLTKACDLDWVLEDIYDDTDSGEDESTEKPGNNQNNKPSSAPAPDPNTSSSITTRPFPIVPAVAASAPGNNSTPANNSSRAMEVQPKRRHRRIHHRRHVIRRVPMQDKVDDQANLNEGRGLNSELDLFSLLGRKYFVEEKANTEKSRRIVPLISPIKRKNVGEETRSFTMRDFITERHVPFIELPEARTGSLGLDENAKEQDQLESEDFIKVLVGPFERKDIGEHDFFTVQDSVPLAETPAAKMEIFELGKSGEEEEPESDDLIKEDEQVRSSTAHDSAVDYMEMPEGRMENLGLKQNIKKGEQPDNRRLVKLLISLPKRKNDKRRVRPPSSHLPKSDIRSYVQEYLNKLLLRDKEGKIYDSNEYVYIPVVKQILNKESKNQKGSQLVSIINREYSYELPEHLSEEHSHPYFTETLIYNGKPIQIQHLKNTDQGSYLTLMHPQVVSEEPEKYHKPISDTHHVMLQNQNPRRPLLINSHDSDTDRLEEEPHSDIRFPSFNHVNQVKEHILRESVKVNPNDNSEVRNVYEQTRLSVIKNPHVPIDLTLDDHDYADLSEYSSVVKKPEVHVMPNNILLQQLPLHNSKIDFHPKDLNQEGHTLEHQNLLIQQLPLVNSKINFFAGYSDNPPVPLLNRYGEEHTVNKPNLTKLSDIYLQAQSYPIKYPINNPAVNLEQQTSTMISEQLDTPFQQENFYAKPETPEMKQTQHNVYETLPVNPTLQHDAASGQSQNEHQIQHLPLVDMLNKFKGNNLEGSMQKQDSHLGESLNHDAHSGSVVVTSTPLNKYAIKNAV